MYSYWPAPGIADAISHLGRNVTENGGKTWYGHLLLDERSDVWYVDYGPKKNQDEEILVARSTAEDAKAGRSVSPKS